MNFNELIRVRESCRNYNNQPVAKELLDEIAQMARLAPSAVNGQPWSLHAVVTPELVKKLGEALGATNRFARKAPAFLVICQERGSLIAKASDLVRKTAFSAIDTGIFAAYVTLAATSLGLSTCIIGGFSLQSINKVLGFPPAKKIQLIVAVGYTDDQPREKRRKPLESVYQYH